jgi:hypothetical protein
MRAVLWIGGGLMVVLSCQTVQAQGTVRDDWQAFCDRVRLDTHRNMCWPVPFNLADRQATRAPFHIMENNGWQIQNTLGEFHFNQETHNLNTAGVSKLHWIVSSTPLHRRTVFVHRSMSDEQTKNRVDSVQQAIARLLPKGQMPEVLLSDSPPAISPGFYPDAINRSMRQNVPSPVLPSSTSLGGAGSSSGS